MMTTISMVVLFLCARAGAAESVPSADDINDLADAAALTVEKFMRESFELRFRYECSGRFLSEKGRENLRGLAKTATDRLREVTENQKELNQRIEDYEGNDWEARYGSTGLWRKLQRDRYVTSLSKCEIDYYLALSAELPKRNAILHKTLNETDSIARIHNTPYAQLIKAKTHALLAQTEPTHRLMAKEKFNRLMYRSDMDEATALRTAIEKIKFLGLTTPDELDNLAKAIAKSSCSDDIELVLSLALLQRRYNAEALGETLRKHPQIEGFLGDCILWDLSGRMEQGQLDLQIISVLEAELAAQAAWKRNTEEYTRLLNQLANTKKHQTPLVLYVAAVAHADSSPTKAVSLLVKASRLQQAQQSDKLNIEAVEVARQAAQLAYNLFAQGRRHCPLALDALGNYASIAGERIDEELEYLDAVVLNSCGRAQKSKELLTKIAARPAGRWRNRARLDLITTTIREQPQQKNEQSGKMLQQLSTLIVDCTAQNESDSKVRTEALKIYCELLLQSKNNASAQKVLDTITVNDTGRDPNLNVFKAKALRRMGRLNESAEYLIKVCRAGDRQYVFEAEELLSEIIEQIDLLQEQQENLPQFMKNCTTIARYCEGIALSTYGLMPVSQARLYLAEVSVLAANEDQESLFEADRMLDVLAEGGLGDNVDYLRCRARLLTELGKFDEAAEAWTKIAEIRKDDPAPPRQRSWKWWRAKYYALHCRSKCRQTDKESLLHTIEVLENSFTTVPPLWAEKIRSLRQIQETAEFVPNN
jgi:tetratricopeptide (TPR) repeat protein